jgi:hypothetical protein
MQDRRITLPPGTGVDPLDKLAWREGWDFVEVKKATATNPYEVVYATPEGVLVHFVDDRAAGPCVFLSGEDSAAIDDVEGILRRKANAR